VWVCGEDTAMGVFKRHEEGGETVGGEWGGHLFSRTRR
jgi:hypothetical protein